MGLAEDARSGSLPGTSEVMSSQVLMIGLELSGRFDEGKSTVAIGIISQDAHGENPQKRRRNPKHQLYIMDQFQMFTNEAPKKQLHHSGPSFQKV
jgi:hypothetical protein